MFKFRKKKKYPTQNKYGSFKINKLKLNLLKYDTS